MFSNLQPYKLSINNFFPNKNGYLSKIFQKKQPVNTTKRTKR